eukprot:11081008-Ditylum_brightwellii.AAC.2
MNLLYLEDTSHFCGMERELYRVWKDSTCIKGPILQELWNYQRMFHTMPKDVVFKVLQDEQEFQVS